MEKWLDSIYFVCIASIGGLVSYLTTETNKFNLKNFLIKGISSGFAGYLVSLLCIYAELPTSMTAFLCGTFGYLGSEATIAIIRKKLIKKIDNL